jgi:hypothetical protein
MDAQLAHIQYCENVTWETLCGVHKTKTIKNKLFLQSKLFTFKMQEGEKLACVHQHGEGDCESIMFH